MPTGLFSPRSSSATVRGSAYHRENILSIPELSEETLIQIVPLRIREVCPFLNHDHLYGDQKELNAVFADAVQSFKLLNVFNIEYLQFRREPLERDNRLNDVVEDVVHKSIGQLRLNFALAIKVNDDVNVFGGPRTGACVRQTILHLKVIGELFSRRFSARLDINFDVIFGSSN